MKKDNRRHILFRYGFIIFVILAFSGAIVAKLVDTTVLSAEEWNAKAMKELSRVETILPERGNILADDGSILATNLRYYTVRVDFRSEKFMEKMYRDSLDRIADSLALYFPIRSKAEWVKRLSAPIEKPDSLRPRAFKLLANLSYADLMRLKTFPFFNIKNPNRNGLVSETYMRRVNPYGDMARRSIGSVGELKNSEIRGLSGLEKALDTLLYGVPGYAKKIPLTKGIVNWTDIPATPGYDIKTTIDINMQDIVENELNDILEYCGAHWGVAVLMEVATGDIKAISNLERNNRGSGYIEGMNRAVLGYEPGSVIKTLSMMIALEDGIVNNPNEVITTGFSWAYAGGRPITDAHGAQSMTVSDVIERSSNIGMSRIIARKYDSNPGAFYSRIKSLGFLEPMNTGIAGERVPRVDSIETSNKGRIAMSRMCYGYATEIPPLSTLAIYNAIANNGRYVRPRLVSQLIGSEKTDTLPVTYIRDRICSEKNAAKLREMLHKVVRGDHGTGRLLRNDLVEIAGKTGTCYEVDPETHTYDTSSKRLAFCGFFPAEKPKYSCIVLICRPTRNAFGAASTSGQVLRNIALKLFSRGMLDNSSDFVPDQAPNSRPTFYASTRKDRSELIRSEFAIPSSKVLQRGGSKSAGVPDVRGLGLRDAITTLENSGYNVAFSGTGYVARQSIAPGTGARRGSTVTLSLSN